VAAILTVPLENGRDEISVMVDGESYRLMTRPESVFVTSELNTTNIETFRLAETPTSITLTDGSELPNWVSIDANVILVDWSRADLSESETGLDILIDGETAILVRDDAVYQTITYTPSESEGRGVNGTAEIVEGGILFTPEAGFFGYASFIYTISDGIHGDDTATVRINVLRNVDDPENSVPVAVEDNFNGTEDTILIITISDLVGNDTDSDVEDVIEFVSVNREGVNGTATRLLGDTIYLTPAANHNGEAVFTYTITDGIAVVDGTFTVDFAPVNDAPIAVNDGRYEFVEDTEFRIDPALLMANDFDLDEGDSISFLTVRNGSNGVVDFIDGEIVFTPRAEYFGNASFDYVIVDEAGIETRATVFLTVTPSNDAPTALTDPGYTIDEEGSFIVVIADLLANDFDKDGDEISFDGIVSANDFIVVDNDDGTITLTGVKDEFGATGFTYAIIDPEGLRGTATVSVDILPVDDDPTAINDRFNGIEDMPLVIPMSRVLANDFDVDGQTIVFTDVMDGEGGVVSLNEQGNFVFTSFENFNGEASFTYLITDTTGATDTAVVTIDFAPVNDAIELGDDVTDVTSEEDRSFFYSLPENLFTDIDGDEIIITATLADGSDLPVWLSFEGNFFAGTPPQDFNGSLSLIITGSVFTATDGEYSATQSLVVTIIPVNDAPIVRNAIADVDLAVTAGYVYGCGR